MTYSYFNDPNSTQLLYDYTNTLLFALHKKSQVLWPSRMLKVSPLQESLPVIPHSTYCTWTPRWGCRRCSCREGPRGSCRLQWHGTGTHTSSASPAARRCDSRTAGWWSSGAWTKATRDSLLATKIHLQPAVTVSVKDKTGCIRKQYF